jgi:predicted adenine nucleotide alpha hydrolase (AANH) superfamily ATPase
LRDDYAVTGFFFNPNIHPPEEYRRRLDAAKTVCDRLDVKIIEGAYEPERFYEAIKGWEDEPENGNRCPFCYRLRLKVASRYAAENGYGFLASTLTVGPMKKAAVIDPIGEEEACRAGLIFIASDWKKKDGFRHSCDLSREYGIYRQHYCGCEFSMRE